jgi:hypothetical protein
MCEIHESNGLASYRVSDKGYNERNSYMNSGGVLFRYRLRNFSTSVAFKITVIQGQFLGETGIVFKGRYEGTKKWLRCGRRKREKWLRLLWSSAVFGQVCIPRMLYIAVNLDYSVTVIISRS